MKPAVHRYLEMKVRDNQTLLSQKNEEYQALFDAWKSMKMDEYKLLLRGCANLYFAMKMEIFQDIIRISKNRTTKLEVLLLIANTLQVEDTTPYINDIITQREVNELLENMFLSRKTPLEFRRLAGENYLDATDHHGKCQRLVMKRQQVNREINYLRRNIFDDKRRIDEIRENIQAIL